MELLKNLEGLSADEQMTAVVELQKAAMKHLEEQKQASIGKSAELVIQGLKKIKSDFEAKFDSLNYDIQTKVASLKDGEQGLQGPKGDQGERGLDGANGRDGRDGKDGKDGIDGVDGVGVRDAKIDFDGSLVISLTDGREINCGEVVSVDVAKQIQKVTHNIQTGAGGDSQTVLDAIAAIQATIATYGTMATQNANAVAITGGTINNTTIGATTPSTGVFTTLTATGQTSLGGAAGSEGLRVTPLASSTTYINARAGINGGNAQIGLVGTGNTDFVFYTLGTGAYRFLTGGIGPDQFRVSHTASAVNYVQVTGAATTAFPIISSQGSDSAVSLGLTAKGGNAIIFFTNSGSNRGLRVSHTASSVNYVDVSGGATGSVPVIGNAGSDSNIGLALKTTGTGAIDLAAGSRGVNISNGGTVTAITTTANGTAYTSLPSVAISAPTTAGGVQATASISAMFTSTATVNSGGTGYTIGDVLTLVGGTVSGGGGVGRYTVASVSSGVITAVTRTQGNYLVLPTNPVSVTGGTGTDATLNLTWLFQSASITNAGSGYVEQPTVTFSGGGGSGAAAFARVGGTVSLTSLGSTLNLNTEAGTGFRVLTAGTTATDMWQAISNGNTAILRSSNATANGQVQTSGTGGVQLGTNSGVTQCLVSHTASAVNYVQVTGAATTASPSISAQGSDTNLNLNLQVKGTGAVSLAQNRTNYISAFGAGTGGSPSFLAQGSDTNIDLALTPKGTGNVRFGTYTGTALSIAGYIEIKDSGGTVRKLAVVA